MPEAVAIDALNPVYQQFALASATWFATLFDYANQLFLMLATIEIGLGAIQWMVAQQSHDYVAMGLFRKILWIGIMYAILLNAHEWIPAVISSFSQAGREAAQIQGLNPGEIFSQGVGLASTMLGGMMRWNMLYKPAVMFSGLFASWMVFFAFLAIAIQMGLTLMESYIVIGGGIFLLGFGAFRGTVSIAEKFLSYMIGVGIKLFVISLMVGAGSQLVMQWLALAQDARFLDIVSTPMAIAGGALLFGIASWMIPSLAASMVSGAVGFGIQEAMGTTMMAARFSMAEVAAPAAIASGGAAATGIALRAAKNAGGGIGGAIRGLGTGAAAIGREARNAAVPTLGGAVRNLQTQRNNSKGDDE